MSRYEELSVALSLGLIKNSKIIKEIIRFIGVKIDFYVKKNNKALRIIKEFQYEFNVTQFIQENAILER